MVLGVRNGFDLTAARWSAASAPWVTAGSFSQPWSASHSAAPRRLHSLMRPAATWRPRTVTHRTSGSPNGRTRRGRPTRVGGHLVDQNTLAELGRPGAEDVDVVSEVAILARRIDNAATPVLHLHASEDLAIRSCGVTACILAARHAAHVAVHCRPRAPADVERLRPLPAARPPGCVQRRACPHAVPSLSRSVPELVLRDSPRLARTMLHARPPERRTGSRRAVRSRSREPAAGVWRSICAGELRTAPHRPAGAAMAVSDKDSPPPWRN